MLFLEFDLAFFIKTYIMINLQVGKFTIFSTMVRSLMFTFSLVQFLPQNMSLLDHPQGKNIKEKKFVTSQICVYLNKNNLNVEEFQPQLLKFKS
jgi:hypothetical protein